MLDHFKSVQQNHLDLLRAQSQEQQLTRGVKILDLSDSDEDEDHEDSDETNKYSLWDSISMIIQNYNKSCLYLKIIFLFENKSLYI